MDDTACQDVELAGRKDVTSRLVGVGVDAVQVDGPQGHARWGHPRRDGHDVAMRLMEDNKGERVRPGREMGATHTINCRSLRRPLRISGMCEFWTSIRGRIGSGGIGRRRACSRGIVCYR
jgi:hypothetical protein